MSILASWHTRLVVAVFTAVLPGIGYQAIVGSHKVHPSRSRRGHVTALTFAVGAATLAARPIVGEKDFKPGCDSER